MMEVHQKRLNQLTCATIWLQSPTITLQKCNFFSSRCTLIRIMIVALVCVGSGISCYLCFLNIASWVGFLIRLDFVART